MYNSKHAPITLIGPASADRKTETTRSLTYGELCQLEPQFRLLLIQAASTCDSNPNYSANHVWYGNGSHEGLKDQMIRLLDRVQLPQSVDKWQVYDVAYDTLYDLLPPCK